MDVSGLLSYFVSFAIMGGIFAILALGLNVQWGYTGLFNIGIAGFFAVGAYTSALLTTPMPEGVYATYVEQLVGLALPFPLGLIGAAAVSGLLALLVGIPTLFAHLGLAGMQKKIIDEIDFYSVKLENLLITRGKGGSEGGEG